MMMTDQSVLSSSDDEIDLREVFAALHRRWRWVFGCGFLGLAMAVGAISLKARQAPLVQASLVVNVAQGPCYSRSRKINAYKDPSVARLICFGEMESVRLRFIRVVQSYPIFASSNKSLIYNIGLLSYDNKGKEKSSNHLA